MECVNYENDIKRIYEVIFVDEYNNFDLIGYFNDLDNCIDLINDRIDVYGNGKYKLKKGDIKPYASTMNECFDFTLGSKFEEEFGEEAYDDFQGCEVRGFIHEFTLSDYELIKKFTDDYEGDFKPNLDFELTYDKLVDLLEKNQNKAILAYLKENKEKALYELSGSLLKEYAILTEEKTYVDFDKAEIDKSLIRPHKYWEEFLRDYDGKFSLCEDIGIADVELVGYNVFQYEFQKYYIKDDSCFIERYTYYNDTLKKVETMMVKKRVDAVC